MVTVFRLLVPLNFALLGVLLVSNVVVVLSLRRQFPALWQSLGQPVRWIYLTRTTKANHFFTFLDSKRYLETNDPLFIRQCQSLQIGWRIFFSSFLATILVGVANLVFANAL